MGNIRVYNLYHVIGIDINLDEIFENLVNKVQKAKPKLIRNDKVCGVKRTFGESEACSITQNDEIKIR